MAACSSDRRPRRCRSTSSPSTAPHSPSRSRDRARLAVAWRMQTARPMRLVALFVLVAGCHGSAGHDGDGGVPDDLADTNGSGDDLATAAPADLATGPADMGRSYSTDPGTFMGTPRCAALHAQLCDDFEAAALDTATWTASGAVSLDTSQFARGKQALHLHLVGQAWATISETKTFPEGGNHFFGRL